MKIILKALPLLLLATQLFALTEDERAKLMRLVPEYKARESAITPTVKATPLGQEQNGHAPPPPQNSVKVVPKDKDEEKQFIQFKEKARANILAVEQNPDISPKEKAAMIEVLQKIQNYTLEDFRKVKIMIERQTGQKIPATEQAEQGGGQAVEKRRIRQEAPIHDGEE